MQGFSQVNAKDYFPQESANQIANAYSRMGMAQAQIENRQEEEAQREKEAKKRRLMTGLVLAGALGGHGAAAILKSKGATALAGGLNTAGLSTATGTSDAATMQEIARIGGTTAAGASGAGAGSGFMSGLSTFGQGALSGITGGSSAAGTGGAAGALGTTGDILGRMGTRMLMNGATGGGGSAGESAGQAAMGALGSYMQEVQGANKSSRVMEGMLKDPAARSALFPGIDQNQTDAILKYKDTLGTIDGARFLQTAIPMLSKTATGNVDFDRQMQLQGLRNEPTYARGIAELAGSRGGGGYTPLPPVDFTQFGGLPPAQQQQNYGGAWTGVPFK
jgi:hypothetical protein